MKIRYTFFSPKLTLKPCYTTNSCTRYDQKTVYYADNNNRLLEEQDFFYKKGGENDRKYSD